MRDLHIKWCARDLWASLSNLIHYKRNWITTRIQFAMRDHTHTPWPYAIVSLCWNNWQFALHHIQRARSKRNVLVGVKVRRKQNMQPKNLCFCSFNLCGTWTSTHTHRAPGGWGNSEFFALKRERWHQYARSQATESAIWIYVGPRILAQSDTAVGIFCLARD